MKKEELSDAMNEIEEDIIETAAEKRVKPAEAPRRKPPVFAWAAGLTGLAAAAVVALVLLPRMSDGGVPVTGTTTPEQTTFVTTTAEPATATTSAEIGTVSGMDGEPDDSDSYFRALKDRARPESSIVKSVSAVNTVGNYITTDTALKIEVKGDVSEDILRSHIALNDGGEFTLTRGEGGSYLLRTAVDFSRGETVKLSVSDDSGEVCGSYAFATMAEFAVKSVYPGSGDNYVLPDTGVEIAFTCTPDISKAAGYFTITPGVNGRFTKAGNRLVFSHDDAFEPMTDYTVTLKAGFPSADGQTLKEDKTFSFRTSAGYGDMTYFYTGSSNSGFSESFLPGDRACVEIHCSDDLRELEYELHLYGFDSADAYAEAVKQRMNGARSVETAGLPEVYSSAEKPYYREGDSNSVYVLLPEQLANGYYAADISAADGTGAVHSIQYLLEVSPLSVYSLSLGEENIFYVNNSGTGEPAIGAEVTLETGGKTYSGRVDSDGIAKIDTAGETGMALLRIDSRSDSYADAFVLSDAKDMKYDDLFYTYIYTDREQYLTTDTIKVWGVLIPRAHNTALPSGLRVMLGDTLTGDGEEVPVTVTKNGTFTAEFSYRNHKGDFPEVCLKSGDDIIVSKTVGIFDYVKPEYIVDLTVPEYVVLPHRDPFEVGVNATYYEGTPAEGLVFSVNGGNTLVTTDENGSASESITAGDFYADDWRAQTMYVDAELTGIENVYISSYKNIEGFFRDVMLRYNLNEKNDLTVYTNKIDFSKADEFFEKRYTDEYKDKSAYSIMKGDPVDTEVHVTVTHHWTEAEEIDSYYDYLEKRTVKRYRYNNQSTQVAAYKLTTENGKYTLRGLPFVADNGRYVVKMNYSDTNGDNVELSFTVYMDKDGRWSEYGYDGYNNYGDTSRQIFYTIDMETDLRGDNYYAYFHTFTEDEDIKFTLSSNSPEASVDGKLLLAVYKSDFIDYKVYDMSKDAAILFRATKDLIPDANFEGAYFDGTHVYKADGGTMFYDPSERGLNIQASCDKEKYDTGDTAKINVRVTDNDGNAVSGAAVHLSCVDEAAFAMAYQDADILSGVYSHIWYPRAISRTSYIQHFFDNGFAGEKGGGGESGTRRDFKDTAFFGEEVTGADGTAVFSVKLPDNLTTWRATLFSTFNTSESRLYAGTELLPVVVSRDVIITPIMQNTYTEGDDISVSAKCAGLPSGGKISVKLSGAGADKEISISPMGTADFGKLPAGEYKVTFMTDGDAVEMPLKVVKTQLETDIVREADLADLTASITPTKYPVTVAFFDKEYMLSTQIMKRLVCYYGQNLGMRLAAAYSAVQLGYMTEQEMIDEFLPETSSTLARELPAADTSVELTALMCAAVPEAVNRDKLISVLWSYSGEYLSDMADRCAVHMALAALGENILPDTRELLESGKVDSSAAGIYLSAALAFSGDYDGAYNAYIRYAPAVKFDDSDLKAVKAYIQGPDGDRQMLTRTALITASLLDLPEAEAFARYLSSEDPQYDSYGLQLTVYLSHFTPKVKGEASFTYRRDGVTQTVTLNRHHPTVMTFTEEQLAEADFTVRSGAVYTLAGYVGMITENPEAPALKVTKTLSGEPEPGQQMTVTIKAAPYSVVYDVIPSCGRIAMVPGMYCNTNGQQIILYTNKHGEASYSFTVNLSGEFVVESAAVVDFSSGEWGMSDRSTLKIGGAANEA